MARIACLLVPDLPLWAELRAHPEWEGRLLAVTSGPEARSQVLAVSDGARAAGVRPPCSLSRARGLCPELRVRPTSLAGERAAREALLDAAFSCSPRAAPVPRSSGVFAAEAAVWADAEGVERVFGSEAGFASALAARARGLALPAVVAIASGREVAHLVARALAAAHDAPADERPVRVLGPEDESRFLARLPVDLLDPDDALSGSLTRFGIRTVGDLLRLPRGAAARRLGPGLLALADRARGDRASAALPPAPEPRPCESCEPDWPLEHLEPLGFVLRGLLDRLLGRLALRHRVCAALFLDLRLEGGGRDRRRVAPAAPTADARVLLRLLSLALEERPPEAAVQAVALSAEGRGARRDQLDLFRPRGPDPAALDRTLAELESLCGAGRVGSPRCLDDHRPQAFGLEAFAPERRGSGVSPPAPRDAAPTPAGARLGVRALRPPVSARVRMGRQAPEWVESAVARGRVVQASGPWRITGGWWSEARYAFDHYDVQVENGTVVRLAFDFVRRRWSIDALYD